MSRKTIVFMPLIGLLLLIFTSVWTGLYDSPEDVLKHLKDPGVPAFYFEGTKGLEVGRPEEESNIVFRVSKKGFEHIRAEKEEDGWKAEDLFIARLAGRAWILYDPGLLPNALKDIEAQGNEMAARADRLVTRHRIIRASLYVIMALCSIIIILCAVLPYGIVGKTRRKKMAIVSFNLERHAAQEIVSLLGKNNIAAEIEPRETGRFNVVVHRRYHARALAKIQTE
jgi:hypothetical protein